jgi:hypothetical protein
MYDCFHVEAGVSADLKWPAFVTSLPYEIPIEGQSRFRISRLWTPSANAEAWWLGRNMLELPLENLLMDCVEDEVELSANVESTVNKCIMGISDYVLPYFSKLLEGNWSDGRPTD